MKKILVAILIAILTSCATRTKIEYRDRDVNHYITNTVHDTLVQHSTDSVYFEVITKGDTVFKTKYKERTMWRDRIVERYDTIVRDSIVTEYKETIKEVTKIPKIYRLCALFSILFVIFATIKLIRWLKQLS